MNNTLLAIDFGSSSVKAVIAKPDLEHNIGILGIGTQKSQGIYKGIITNIEDAANSIRDAVLMAKKNTLENFDTTVVSISGNHTKSIRSSGSVNVPNGIITETEINQVMQMALYNATIVPEYEVIHVIPIHFKVDDTVDVDNPLNMNGSRLEASVFIVTAKRTSLTNIKSALKISGIENCIFVLDGYASAMALLDSQQKKFGATVINLGDSTTEFVCFKSNSLIFNGFIPVGSSHITNDLSEMLHTPPAAAEKLKIDYGSLIKDYSPKNDLGITKVKIPRIGDEHTSSEVALESIQTIIHARVEEILILIRKNLKKSGLLDNIGSGIVVTGGMSNLDGIKVLAQAVFDGIPVSISAPKNIKNGFMSLDEPTMSTIVGILYLMLGKSRGFELDSNKKLVRPIKVDPRISKPAHVDINTQKADDINTSANAKSNETNLSNLDLNNKQAILTPLDDKQKKKGVGKFWTKISEWF